MAYSRANRATYQKMTNDLLHGLFSLEYLAQHTLAGGNDSKEKLPEDIVARITGT
jgi:hypothetical protein